MLPTLYSLNKKRYIALNNQRISFNMMTESCAEKDNDRPGNDIKYVLNDQVISFR